MNLPPELRLEIIAYTVISPSTISWQGSYIGDKEPGSESARKYVCNGINAYLPPRYNIAAPLLTNRALYILAAPLFYRKNTFRFRSAAPGLPLAFASQTSTTYLHHLTIGIPTNCLSERQLQPTDEINSARMDEIARLCPALRTFTIHIPEVFEGFTAIRQPLRQGILRRRRLRNVVGGMVLVIALGLFIYAVRLCTI